MAEEENFSWSKAESTEIIQRSVQAVAVYFNPAGDIVIRQEANAYEAHDSFVILPVDACERLIEKLSEMVQEHKRS